MEYRSTGINSRHPREGGDPARRVCGVYESYDALTRFQTPAFAGVTMVGN
jgi:hypothetical protein